MVDVLVFGTGSGCEKMLLEINMEKINVVAFIDNNPKKQNMIFNEKIIILPNEIEEYKFNYIIICSEYYKEIITQLQQLNIDKNRILSWYYYSNDQDFKSEYNNKILNELRIPTSNYFIELRNNKKEKKMSNDIIKSLPDSESFKKFDMKYYNKNYSKKLGMISDCIQPISFCEKVVEILLDECRGYLKSNSNLRVLDIGCGAGGFSEAFRRKGFYVKGIDYSKVAIGRARSNYVQCEFLEMDATNPVFNKEKFDLLFMRGLSIVINTHDLNIIKEILNKYFYCVNDGGIFIVVASTNFTGRENGSETVNFTVEEIKELATIVKFKYVDILYPEEKIIRLKKFDEKKFFYLVLQK
ncbi:MULTISPECIES: class I SAM-dependent methyltransferase [unclassified Clostridium]|uniref:class I SAM-dependent methyltransferase n=1 Tax=unclassified Clostridium TaxID=2614128 RepID=UPI0013F95DDF|nr:MULTISPECIES: class I SAM-dependent methyltransferase [unclassified Clostridium]NFR87441.1 class I SAM-dependent methyltransferase [Clostridium botulinum]NFR89391.1 class I SAM-dependent methyltransferase [Clostridium botulinum]NFT98970.1 class I SAM-dependent methyltransferase [Clostridium botulinum]